jgi:hypothetical protein
MKRSPQKGTHKQRHADFGAPPKWNTIGVELEANTEQEKQQQQAKQSPLLAATE